MPDYPEIGLNNKNNKLQSETSILANRVDITGLDFDANYELSPGATTYKTTNYATRSFKAVVGLDRSGGQFENIQSAIEYVDSLGGGIVFIRKGTYSINKDITLPSNVSLVGEDRNSTILDFSGASLTSGGIIANGTSVSTAGTVSVASTKVVTGTSTQFLTDGVVAGDYLVVNSIPYLIKTVSTETSLTLSEWLTGGSVNGISTDIGKYTRNISVCNLTIKNVTGTGVSGLNLDYCINTTVNNISVSDSLRGMNLGKIFNLLCSNNITKHNTEVGIQIGNVVNGSVFSNYVFNNGTSGSDRSGILCSAVTSDSVIISQNSVIGNGGEGIYLLLSDEVVVANNIIKNNDNYGIFLEGSTNCVVNQNMVKASGNNGIMLSARVAVNSLDNIVSSNMVLDGSAWGISLDANQDGNLIHGNFTAGNSSGTIDDNGTGNSVVDNYS